MKNKIKNNIYFLWSILFVITALLFFSPFAVEKKAIIFGNGGDGIAQHYTALAYYGKYLRGIIYDLLVNHKFSIPMWDSSIGYGSDIVTTLSYYVMGDPFSFLAIFCPEQYTEYLYEMLIVLRLYFAGVFFIMYCNENKKEKYASLIGALVYVFSGYSVFAPILHPYFATPMVWYPLILMGIDRIFRGKKPSLYIVGLTMAALSNFYFFYMFVILILMYSLFRSIEMKIICDIKEFLILVGKMMGFSIISCGCAAVLLLSTVLSMIGSSRIEVEHFHALFYPLQYYKEFLGTFTTATLNGYYSYMGYAGISIICILALVLNKKRYIAWKVYFVLFTLMLLIPFFGTAFNGMAYVTNRWIWAYAFLIGYICADQLPYIISHATDIRLRITLVIGALCYILLMYLSNKALINIKHIVSVLFIVAVLILLTLDKLRECYRNVILLVLVILNVSMNAFFAYSSHYDNYLANFQNAGTAFESDYYLTPGYHLKEITKLDKNTRFDTLDLGPDRLLMNSSLLTQTCGTAFYYSSSNSKDISEFQTDLNLKFQLANYYWNLDGRNYLQKVMGAKYVVAPAGYGEVYGYKMISSDEDYNVYEDTDTLGKAIFYKKYVPESDYEKYYVTKKQQTLLQGAVVDRNYDDLEICDPVFQDSNLEYQIDAAEGIEVKDDVIEVLSDNATMKLSFEGLDNSETYLIFDYIDYEDTNYWYKTDLKDFWHKLKAFIWNHQNNGRVRTTIIATGNVKTNSFDVSTVRENYYAGRHEFLLNMGYCDKAQNEITLTFPYHGKYKISNMRVVCQPMESIESYVQALNNGEIYIDDNDNEQIISVSTDGAGILCYSLPYSDGWSVEVDGQKAEIEKVNTMFLGVHIPDAGEHLIRFCYRTPYLGIGAIISLLSLVIAYFVCKCCRVSD